MSSIDRNSSSSSSLSSADLGISRETPSGINLCEIDSLEDVFQPNRSGEEPSRRRRSRPANHWSPQRSQPESTPRSPDIASPPVITHFEEAPETQSPASPQHDMEMDLIGDRLSPGSPPTQSPSPQESPGDRLCPHSPVYTDDRNNNNDEDCLKYWESEHSMKPQAESPPELTSSFWSSFLTSGTTVPTPPKIGVPNEEEPVVEDEEPAIELEQEDSQFHIFEAVTPEPLTDCDETYDEEIYQNDTEPDMQDDPSSANYHCYSPTLTQPFQVSFVPYYPDNCEYQQELEYDQVQYDPTTVAEQMLVNDPTDEAIVPGLLESETAFDSSAKSSSTYHIIDTESQAAMFANIDSELGETETEDEEFEETCSIPAADHMEPIGANAQTLSSGNGNLELPVTSNSSADDIFIDAEEDLERKSSSHYWTCEELSNLIDLAGLQKEEAGTQSPKLDLTDFPEELNEKAGMECGGRCSRVLERIFQMHVAENTSENQGDQQNSELPSVPDQPVVTDFKDYEAIQANLESMVDGDLLKIQDETRWDKNADIVDTICVEIDVQSIDPKDPTVQKVGLRFPVHKDDAKSAMVLVNNVHLRNPSVQFVDTTAQISYYLPNHGNACGDSKHLIGQFKIRSRLAIPVSFKLCSVSHLELTPSIGILLPRQKTIIQVHTNLNPDSIGIEQLRIEGILLYAAPFVFNLGRTANNLTPSDLQEFWGKFSGPRFRYAQSKFIALHVYQPCTEKPEESSLSALRTTAWNILKCLNPFKVTPQVPSMDHKCPKDVLRNKSLSPLGHMIIRRRQSLAMEAARQAEILNDRRTTLMLTVIMLLALWSWFYFNVYRVEVDRKLAESYKLKVATSWWRNFVAMHTKVWFRGT